MKRYLLLVIIILLMLSFFSTRIYSWNFPEDFAFVGLEKIAKDIKKSVFAVQTEGNLQNENKNDDYISLGTGFLMTNNNIVLGITCEHVIRPAIKNDKPILIGLNTSKGLERFECRVVFNDQEQDIAILAPQKPTSLTDVELKNLILDNKYLAKGEEIAEGRGIIIIGYPLGLGIEHDENNPIIKFGIVAQYTGADHFLVDGVANPGNSGSPVFDLRAEKFIGMVQAYNTDFIELFDQKGQLTARLPYNSGLSSVLSSSVILKVLENVNIPQENINTGSNESAPSQ